jgi:hypothetical protein
VQRQPSTRARVSRGKSVMFTNNRTAAIQPIGIFCSNCFTSGQNSQKAILRWRKMVRGFRCNCVYSTARMRPLEILKSSVASDDILLAAMKTCGRSSSAMPGLPRSPWTRRRSSCCKPA